MSPTETATVPQLLLQTKLYQPQVATDLIARPHLLDHLNQNLERKLTLITAPTGYGKTTLAAQWLAHLAETQQQVAATVAWLSLDAYDNELPFFLRYLVAAIQTTQPGFGANIVAAIHSSQPPSWPQLAIILANDLATLSAPLILTLDDYHTITDESIQQLINRLLGHLPPSLHLVLLSRTEPLLALGRLRARRQVAELRAANLAFSLTETTRFVTQALGRGVQSETIQALHSNSEGWAAGLQLAALSLPRQTDEAHQTLEAPLLKHFQSNTAYVTDYLFEEVLDQQATTIQEFLLRTAILDRFCVPLCQAVLGAAWLDQVAQDDQLPDQIRGSQVPMQLFLAWLHRTNLFLVPLDSEGVWYRYHHLFQQMLMQRLQQRLSAYEIATLHRQAGAWLTTEGLIEPAIQHALAADDTQLAAALIEQHGLNALNQLDFPVLKRWLARLPETVIEQHPVLLLLKGWIAVSTYGVRANPAFKVAKQAEACLKNNALSLDKADRGVLQAEIAAVRGIAWFWRDDFQQALYYIQRALADLPAVNDYRRAYTTLMMALVLQATGQPAAALNLLQEKYQNVDTSLSRSMMQLLVYLPTFYYMAGDLQQAVRVGQQLVNRIRQQDNNVPHILDVLYRWLGFIFYEWNNLPAASQYSLKVSQGSVAPYFSSQLSLALIYEVQGQTEAAQQVVEKLHHWLLEINSSVLLNGVISFQARFLLWQGKIDLALQHLLGVKMTDIEQGIWASVEIPPFTWAKALIAHNQASSWREAEALLRKLRSTAERTQNISRQIELLALEALLCQKQGQPNEALATLEQAITLAKPGGFIRTFVDLGSPMAQLLYRLLERGVEPDYLGQIVVAFPTAPSLDQANGQKSLIEPLTDRELETLTLLTERLTNKEIAQRLGVSPSTVKYHLDNIYQKLGVTGRRQAVAQAKALGLVS